MKINCSYCRKTLNTNDKVVIDVLNSLYHSDCYNENGLHEILIDWKDFGTLEDIFEKHSL